ncbi:LytR C-terminal domain-containing protein [Streptantibioticus parmotrematis]|uniref:LytR C-terminal domain-containing protein n=1 Tax=Streptantibioticus parmotrematis TaxID=2873249 RepID=UPI0033C579DB
MSMLTPPGMGGKYRVTGKHYPRMRRPRGHRRLVLSVVSAVVVLGLIGWGTVQLIHVFGGTSHDAAQDGRCSAKRGRDVSTRAGGAPADVPLPKPATITVNVYNATPRTGLAKSTADELKKRGFVIGKVGNAPAQYNQKVPGPAILLGGPQAQSALKVLGTQLSGSSTKTDPSRTGAPNVDLIIGSGFGSLTPQQNAGAALAALSHPAPAASASGKKDC